MNLNKALTLRQLAEAILALPEHEQREPAFVNSPLFFGPVVSVGHLGHVTELASVKNLVQMLHGWCVHPK